MRGLRNGETGGWPNGLRGGDLARVGTLLGGTTGTHQGRQLDPGMRNPRKNMGALLRGRGHEGPARLGGKQPAGGRLRGAHVPRERGDGPRSSERVASTGRKQRKECGRVVAPEGESEW